MAECFSVACYVGHQPGGSYRTLGFSFEYLYCFFFQFHLGIKSAAGFIAAPAIGPKAKPSQITHVKFYKKILRFLVQQNTALFSTFRLSGLLHHRRNILTFLDIWTVYNMKTIYFLNTYHLGW